MSNCAATFWFPGVFFICDNRSEIVYLLHNFEVRVHCLKAMFNV